MPDSTPLLSLPFILPAQAQKHVTHNEALVTLDALTQLVVEDILVNTPPASPAFGRLWGIGAAPGGAWAGRAGQLAQRTETGWQFMVPAEGWRAWNRAASALLVWRAGNWETLPLNNMAGLGIGTTYDPTNRLAVSAPASLFSHSGAGHQIKVNKAGVSDTASVLFQTNWSGRAEIGLTGNSDLSMKVSDNGSNWFNALVVAGATGRATLPNGATLSTGSAAAPGLTFGSDADSGLFRANEDEIGLSLGGVQRLLATANGLRVDGLVTGTAVQSTDLDTTAGRLLRVNSFGVGAVYGPLIANIDDTNTPAGFYFFNMGGGTSGTTPGFTAGGLLVMSSIGSGAKAPVQIALERTTGAGRMMWRNSQAGVWGQWRTALGRGDIVGTVSQSGGSPTGTILERGSNSNGDYVRYADGTQMTWRFQTSDASLATTWTFPAAFSATPNVQATVGATVAATAVVAAETATSAQFRAFTGAGAQAAFACRLFATGRWF